MIHSLGADHPTFQGKPTYIADDARIIGRVVLEKDCSIWFNAVLRGDCDQIHLGEGSNVQDGSVLHADFGYPVTVGNGVSIGHKAMLHGCTIGDNVLIGMNATVLNGAVIGDNCIIGANALVTEGKEIPPNSVVVGAPGRVVRQVTEEEVEENRWIAHHYIENGHRFSHELSDGTRDLPLSDQ